MIKYLLIIMFFLVSCKKEKQQSFDTINGDKFYDEGILLLQKNNIEAYKKFQQAINYYKKQKDNSNISKSLICQAIAQQGSGDIFGAEATLVEALKIIKDNDESLYSIYDTLGNLKLDQKEYEQALKWYNKALSENTIPETSRINILSNKSVAAFKLKRYDEALDILSKIDLTKDLDLKLKNRIRDNIEYIKWLKNKNYPAQRNIEAIAGLKQKNSDFWGLNSTYAHLSDIYKNIDNEKSLFYAKKMYETATKIKSPDDKLESIERLIILDSPVNSKNYFNQYKKLSDSIQSSRNDYRTRFSFIKYDSERKELDNAQKELKISRQYFFLGLLGLAIIILIIWYTKRQKQLKQEKELEVKNTQLKMSKRVHDVVANGIYQVMAKIENQKDFDRDKALDELEFVYEKSRDLSYEKAGEEKEFSQEISELIAGFNNATVKTFTAGNDPSVWEKVSPAVKEEVYQMVRELMVNMKKHSQASHVAVKFEKTGETVEIQYKDNGVGISGDLIYKNGLRNTASRIEAIGGTITFDTKIEKGLKVNLSFPAS
ncbi:tetratricopeptide (TPR) repeat protein [Chryseobacterium sp. SORGH_AS 447]|uniref:tetratricopeptide repeat-containing sensor histidine kinase n=1 Tax=Chryseobacterium sp. SORGH_AS_0447 TaxID=3041769 RepID=UPI002786096B|nr:ATP-binding protein [Chryseobacterium sp. SORGH_AS_0447]MDQ1159934.1 tetratricopeptide (TPR) repeat protein [Chryseobacterium sp. SORGH_AS_0447]